MASCSFPHSYQILYSASSCTNPKLKITLQYWSPSFLTDIKGWITQNPFLSHSWSHVFFLLFLLKGCSIYYVHRIPICFREHQSVNILNLIWNIFGFCVWLRRMFAVVYKRGPQGFFKVWYIMRQIECFKINICIVCWLDVYFYWKFLIESIIIVLTVDCWHALDLAKHKANQLIKKEIWRNHYEFSHRSS